MRKFEKDKMDFVTINKKNFHFEERRNQDFKQNLQDAIIICSGSVVDLLDAAETGLYRTVSVN